jgi:hypothetical protein
VSREWQIRFDKTGQYSGGKGEKSETRGRQNSEASTPHPTNPTKCRTTLRPSARRFVAAFQ